MELIIFILACLGCTNIIVFGEIFEWFRNFLENKIKIEFLNKLFSCTTCMGFWVGLILSLIFPVFGLNFFIGGCISSFMNLIYSKIEMLF